jgi:hypothetical protein
MTSLLGTFLNKLPQVLFYVLKNWDFKLLAPTSEPTAPTTTTPPHETKQEPATEHDTSHPFKNVLSSINQSNKSKATLRERAQ